MDVIGRFTAADMPTFALGEIACSKNWTRGSTIANLPGNGLAQHPMLYVGENCKTMFLDNDGKPIWTSSTGPLISSLNPDR